MALENNRALVVQRYNPNIQRTVVQQDLAVFDPVLDANFIFNRTRSTVITPAQGIAHYQDYNTQIGYNQFFPTGTSLSLFGGTSILDNTTGGPSTFSPNAKYGMTAGFGVSQALLRGFGCEVNLATVNQARLDVLNSQYELRGFTETLVASTEEAYWDYALAIRQIEIFEQSLQVAQDQLNQTQERINVGTLARTELAAAEAQVALRREDLIDARNAAEQARLKLLRLISPVGATFDRQVVLQEAPAAPATDMEPGEAYVRNALALRPELNQARLQVNRGDLEIVKTKNGLLPQLDLFANLSKTGYSSSFGGSFDNLDGHNYTLLTGLSFSFPPLNRSARAEYTASVLNRDQAFMAVSNLSQLVEQDVRSALIEVRRAQEQVVATAATRRFQEETLRAENERFAVGKSTTLLVGIAQRDLLSAQIAEVQAIVANLKAMVELYRLNGSLLVQRTIASPGDKPVEMNADLVKFCPPPAG